MFLSDSTPNSIIYKTFIYIEVSYDNEIMNKCSSLFNKKLKKIIKENINELASKRKNKLYLDKIIVDLGNIEFHLFEDEISHKLAIELKKALKKYYYSPEYTTLTEIIPDSKSVLRSIYQHTDSFHNKKPIDNRRPKMMNKNSEFTGTKLLEKMEHYLYRGNWPFEECEHHTESIVCINNELWQQITHQPQQWLPTLAKHCLQSVRLSRLMQICQPEVLNILYQLFTGATTSELINSQVSIDKKVIPEKLSLAAKHYLLNRMTYLNATQQPIALQTKSELTSERDIVENSFHGLKQNNGETSSLTRTALQAQNQLTSTINITQNDSNRLKQTNNKPDMQMDAVPPFVLQPMQAHYQPVATQQHYGLIKQAAGENLPTLHNREQHKELLKSALSASAQVSSIQPDNKIQIPSVQSVLPISNAGCMILWPLLPTFFRAFDLLDKNRFISLEAQREAVCLLDWLIWAQEEIPAWRLTLNKVICGLPINDNALWRAPEPKQQTAISQWLEKTIEQLPAWKNMGTNDVRHLFLQRSGELSGLNSMINIHIKHEVYDALISEWPWPMNMASFSWLQQPITITWL
ncbi:hypothetical protein Xvie_00340 [Xenorhabdus vietnamensis]|uniref:Uncharacterized protein n=1 Tax=Xenorhabdus vietnamensis TaxID=351656 RepID=A0A1Y2SKG5_9GAMM|nr:contractile injection system tape measure protein [Xenorhabdus vietnamensis]OTA18512.1 hypothetical protein Xvie_00340 [Xenorhabdus vietnamensis]